MLNLRYLRIALFFLSACGFADSTDIDFDTIFVTPATDISMAFFGGYIRLYYYRFNGRE